MLERGGDDLLARRANRPAMPRAVAAFCADSPAPLATFTATDVDHDRIETRRHRATHRVDGLFRDRAEPGAPGMPGLAMLACDKALRDDGPPSIRRHHASARLSPGAFVRAVRSQRAIENSLHRALPGSGPGAD